MTYMRTTYIYFFLLIGEEANSDDDLVPSLVLARFLIGEGREVSIVSSLQLLFRREPKALLAVARRVFFIVALKATPLLLFLGVAYFAWGLDNSSGSVLVAPPTGSLIKAEREKLNECPFLLLVFQLA
jgi:hypothetical protein